MLRVYHGVKDFLEANKALPYVVIDLSDAGELGYIYLNTGPDDLTKIKTTIFEVLCPVNRGGRGFFEIWDKMISKDQNNCLFIPGCPMRNLMLQEIFTTYESQGLRYCRDRLLSFLSYLGEKRGFKEIHILISRVPTCLNKIIFEQIKAI